MGSFLDCHFLHGKSVYTFAYVIWKFVSDAIVNAVRLTAQRNPMEVRNYLRNRVFQPGHSKLVWSFILLTTLGRPNIFGGDDGVWRVQGWVYPFVLVMF